MTVRENVRELVDSIPEQQLGQALSYLSALCDNDEDLDMAALATIQAARGDYRNGRMISLEEYRRARNPGSTTGA